MSRVFFSSDWHIGHKNVHKFRSKERSFFRDFPSEVSHREWLLGWVKANLTKNDKLYLLGDICFTMEALEVVSQLPCTIVLVSGNHDLVSKQYKDDTSQLYEKAYKEVYGLTRYKHLWLSHAPIHPQELRGKFSFHGHNHFNNVLTESGEEDHRYFNCCVENLMKIFGEPCVEFSRIVEYRRGLIGEGKRIL